ncbi:MAG: pyridoxamine 5'-phosphate oxidase family protein [Rhizobacter sp.]|nr:pyridoxamine 5'-phosphate oxidase family protein [Chlorobiales bacterium]
MATKTPQAQPESLNREDGIKKLRELVKGIDIAMLTTIGDGGALRSRPMGTQDIDFDGDLWFFTSDESGKVSEVKREQQVGVVYAEPKDNRYVSFSGTATLVKDPAKIKELWKPELKVWFPDGLETPDLALLKVSADHAEYWDAPSSVMVTAISFVKALVTGTEAEMGENKKVDL